jgi:hypothetical protein
MPTRINLVAGLGDGKTGQNQRCIQVPFGNNNNGAPVILYPPAGGDDFNEPQARFQFWDLEGVGGKGYNVFKIRNYATGKVLDAPKDQLVNGAKIMVWDDWGGDNQLWEQIAHKGGALGYIFSYRNLASGKVLDAPGSPDFPINTQVHIWDDWQGKNQRWFTFTWGPMGKPDKPSRYPRRTRPGNTPADPPKKRAPSEGGTHRGPPSRDRK